MRFKQLFNRKSVLVFIMVGFAFHMLFKYRANVDALVPGLAAPDLELMTLDGQKFHLHDYGMPVMLVFLNTKTFMSSALYPDQILRRMPRIKQIEKNGAAGLVVLLDTDQTAEDIKNKIGSKKYKILENTVYLSNIEQATEKYGLSSWPHFFLIDGEHIIAYESKIPSMETIDAILEGR